LKRNVEDQIFGRKSPNEIKDVLADMDLHLAHSRQLPDPEILRRIWGTSGRGIIRQFAVEKGYRTKITVVEDWEGLPAIGLRCFATW
jgi:hypothetical protein